MTCQQAEPLLARAADGTLDAERSGVLARHMVGCTDCRRALDMQRAMREVLTARPQAPAPLGFAARVMASLPEHELDAAAGWLDALNWRAWTLRLAPVAGALFVGAALGSGPSTEVADTGTAEFSELVAAWVSEEAADTGTRDPEELETATGLWQDGDELTDDLLIDVLLAGEPSGPLSGADEAGR